MEALRPLCLVHLLQRCLTEMGSAMNLPVSVMPNNYILIVVNGGFSTYEGQFVLNRNVFYSVLFFILDIFILQLYQDFKIMFYGYLVLTLTSVYIIYIDGLIS